MAIPRSGEMAVVPAVLTGYNQLATIHAVIFDNHCAHCFLSFLCCGARPHTGPHVISLAYN